MKRASRFGVVMLTLAGAVGGVMIAPTAVLARHDEHSAMHPPMLNVTGRATVYAEPDTLTISFSVRNVDKDPSKALDANSAAMTKLMDALKALNLDADAVQTSMFSITPEYNHTSSGQQFRGYSISNTVNVKTKQFKRAGEIITKGVNAGANQVDWIQFSLSDLREPRNKAIAEATARARQNADVLAAAAGVEIKSVHRIDLDPAEAPVMYRPARLGMSFDAAASSKEAPINPSDIEVTATVSVEYAIGPKEPTR